MALITWQDLVERSSVAGKGPIRFHPLEAKKAFDWMIKNVTKIDFYKNLPKAEQLEKIAALISYYVQDGKFVPGVGYQLPGAGPGFTYDELAKNKNFEKGLKSYFENPSDKPRSPELLKISRSNASLKEKWNRLTRGQRGAARESIKFFEARQGTLSLKEFAPFTNFKGRTISMMNWDGKKNLPKTPFSPDHTKIARGKSFLKFLKDNDIEIIQKSGKKGVKGDLRFTIPNKAQQAALLGFLNELDQRAVDQAAKAIVKKHSRDHPLYKNTQQNLKTVLKHARKKLGGSD